MTQLETWREKYDAVGDLAGKYDAVGDLAGEI